ncbi:hypothetical protein KFE25_003582 [Diacronema lutheri]|uniref:SDR family NAD(P)-dependent oxidoreductase n=1 Tax=Diacronema lutheri TaxID=2081491 RepID=A0A8J5X5W1_DIALT|nr:hypothetical protein KFE25_003582 [Diacronema lutheri]
MLASLWARLVGPRELRLRARYGDWALVTGGHSGIGFACAEQLAAEGVNVLICARTQSKLDAAAAAIKDAHPRVQVRTVAADCSEQAGVDALIAATKDVEVGIVVPDAGLFLHGWFVDSDADELRRMLFLNVASPALLSRHFGRRMAERGRGAILLVSSVIGLAPGPYFAGYAATKSFVATLGETLSAEMAPLGVDVSVLVPGLTRTEMATPFLEVGVPADSPEHAARCGLCALGRKPLAIPLVTYRLSVLLQAHVLPRFVTAAAYRLIVEKVLRIERPPPFAASAVAAAAKPRSDAGGTPAGDS